MAKNNHDSEEQSVEGVETGHPPMPNQTPATSTTIPEGMLLVSQDKMAEIEKKLAKLDAIADPNRKHRYEALNAGPRGQKVRIRRFTMEDGSKKYVMATRLIENEFYQNPINGAWIEKQRVEVIFDDASKQVYDYKPFSLNVERVDAEVLQTTKDADGRETLVVELKDGSPEPRKLTIDSVFVN